MLLKIVLIVTAVVMSSMTTRVTVMMTSMMMFVLGMIAVMMVMIEFGDHDAGCHNGSSTRGLAANSPPHAAVRAPVSKAMPCSVFCDASEAPSPISSLGAWLFQLKTWAPIIDRPQVQQNLPATSGSIDLSFRSIINPSRNGLSKHR